jgi:hypothetical protein
MYTRTQRNVLKLADCYRSTKYTTQKCHTALCPK